MQIARPHRLFCNFKCLFVFAVLCAVDGRGVYTTARRIRRSTLVNSAVSECKLTTVNDDYDDWEISQLNLTFALLMVFAVLHIAYYERRPHTILQTAKRHFKLQNSLCGRAICIVCGLNTTAQPTATARPHKMRSSSPCGRAVLRSAFSITRACCAHTIAQLCNRNCL